MRDSENKATRVSQRKMKKKVARALGMMSKMKEIKMRNLLKNLRQIPRSFSQQDKLYISSSSNNNTLK